MTISLTNFSARLTRSIQRGLRAGGNFGVICLAGFLAFIGVLGTGVTEEAVAENAVSVGQREAAKAPEFKDNVLAVESYTEYSHYSNDIFKKGWPAHYHEWDSVGSDRPCSRWDIVAGRTPSFLAVTPCGSRLKRVRR